MTAQAPRRPGRRALFAAGAAATAALAFQFASAAVRANARVGYLEHVKAADGERLYREFVEALNAQGYTPGRNLTIVRRSAGSEPHRLYPLAVEIAASRIDVIVATTTEAAKAARVATRVPAVFVVSGDPVHEGLVASMARPGGLLTGVVTRGDDLTAKRLELLKDAFPRTRSVAIVGSNVSLARVSYAEPARRLGLTVLEYPINHATEYRDAAVAILRGASDAVLVVEDADEVVGLTMFTTLMMATRRPVMFNADVFVEGEGFGLMAYGVSLRERYRRAAAIVARVLDGMKPADIPVEQPTRYELVVNLRAAEVHSIAMPREFVERADRVIR